MYRYSMVCIVLMLIMFEGCESVAKYPIDSKHLIKIDTGLLGIWKEVGDTDKANCILVQDAYDLHKQSQKVSRGWDTSSVKALNDFWKHDEKDFQENKDYCYYLSRMVGHGRGSSYEQFSSFLSVIKGMRFVNVYYRYVPFKTELDTNMHNDEGYFFVKVISLNTVHDSLTTALFADTTLKYATNPQQVRRHIERNLNNPLFYSDTMHFYKVSAYHESLNGSISRAN